jgi:glucokinase
MVTDHGPDAALRRVIETIDDVFDTARSAGASAIGVSVPGWVNSREGILLSATNVPCWRNFPLAKLLSDHYRLDTRLANDANAAALAEAVWGAGSAYHNVFYVSLGTGIGTGMVLDRRLYYGRTGMAGEGGHMSIDLAGPLCGCGKRGCVEVYASGTAVARRARERLAKKGGSGSKMLQLAEGELERVTALVVGQAALEAYNLANEVLREAADFLAVWLGNIIDLLEPEVIILGGGLGQIMRDFVAQIRSGLRHWAINPGQDQIPVLCALYGAESGLVGSAALCLPRAHLWVPPPRPNSP